jgi:uncharacterized membrane protein
LRNNGTQDVASQPDTPAAVAENIESIMALEAEAQPPRPGPLRFAEAVGDFAGTPGFLVLHLIWFGAWAAINLGWVPGVKPFDEYPFSLLGLILAMEAVLLASCVLLKQNRMDLLAEERSHIDLQINLLAERETTKIIQMLERISGELGIRHAVMDEEAAELGEETTVESLARKLRESRDDGETRP